MVRTAHPTSSDSPARPSLSTSWRGTEGEASKRTPFQLAQRPVPCPNLRSQFATSSCSPLPPLRSHDKPFPQHALATVHHRRQAHRSARELVIMEAGLGGEGAEHG